MNLSIFWVTKSEASRPVMLSLELGKSSFSLLRGYGTLGESVFVFCTRLTSDKYSGAVPFEGELMMSQEGE